MFLLVQASLPTWERGLKPEPVMCSWSKKVSLPTWERGLKPYLSHHKAHKSKSLPTWERGLKRITPIVKMQEAQVAPHVGAWIET